MARCGAIWKSKWNVIFDIECHQVPQGVDADDCSYTLVLNASDSSRHRLATCLPRIWTIQPETQPLLSAGCCRTGFPDWVITVATQQSLTPPPSQFMRLCPGNSCTDQKIILLVLGFEPQPFSGQAIKLTTVPYRPPQSKLILSHLMKGVNYNSSNNRTARVKWE